MWMSIRSIAIFKYSLDLNVLIVIAVILSSVDVNEISSNFHVFSKPQCDYNYCSYAVQCGCKSDQ